MKRLLRSALTFATAISGVLCAAACVLWLRSCDPDMGREELDKVEPTRRTYLFSEPGRFGVETETALGRTAAARRSRSARRRRAGRCAKCGYDLRATRGRCPECGAVPEKKAAT